MMLLFRLADLSGGRNDDAALAIAHRDKKVVIDLLARYRPPGNPKRWICRMAAEVLRRSGIRRVVGDNYAAEFVARGFQGQGIGYLKLRNRARSISDKAAAAGR